MYVQRTCTAFAVPPRRIYYSERNVSISAVLDSWPTDPTGGMFAGVGGEIVLHRRRRRYGETVCYGFKRVFITNKNTTELESRKSERTKVENTTPIKYLRDSTSGRGKLQNWSRSYRQTRWTFLESVDCRHTCPRPVQKGTVCGEWPESGRVFLDSIGLRVRRPWTTSLKHDFEFARTVLNADRTHWTEPTLDTLCCSRGKIYFLYSA